MNSLVQAMDIKRTLGAAFVFILAFFLVAYPIDAVVGRAAWAAFQAGVPEPVLYTLFYVLLFLEYLAVLLPAAYLYFWKESVVVWRSVYLGIVFVICVYVFESIENWFQTLVDPEGVIHVGHGSIIDYLLFVIGTVVVAGIVHLLKRPRVPKGAEMGIF